MLIIRACKIHNAINRWCLYRLCWHVKKPRVCRGSWCRVLQKPIVVVFYHCLLGLGDPYSKLNQHSIGIQVNSLEILEDRHRLLII